MTIQYSGQYSENLEQVARLLDDQLETQVRGFEQRYESETFGQPASPADKQKDIHDLARLTQLRIEIERERRFLNGAVLDPEISPADCCDPKLGGNYIPSYP